MFLFFQVGLPQLSEINIWREFAAYLIFSLKENLEARFLI